MESRKNIAIEMHNKGYNCAQSVALTYADLVDMKPEQLFRITEGFGLGGGNMQNSSGDLENPTTKAKTYGLNKEILENFQKRNSSVICHELKGIGTGKVLRSCPDCIMDACEFFENLYETKLKK